MPFVDYPVRTPLAYWAVVGALLTCAALGLAILVAATLDLGPPPSLTILAAVLVVVPVLYIVTTAEYRVAGVLRVAAGEVTVPGPQGRPLRFTTPDLQLSATSVRVRISLEIIPVATIQRGVLLEFNSAAHRRRLSTLTLVDRGQTAALLADLERALRNEPPQANVVDASKPPPARSELEHQLDRELAALD